MAKLCQVCKWVSISCTAYRTVSTVQNMKAAVIRLSYITELRASWAATCGGFPLSLGENFCETLTCGFRVHASVAGWNVHVHRGSGLNLVWRKRSQVSGSDSFQGRKPSVWHTGTAQRSAAGRSRNRSARSLSLSLRSRYARSGKKSRVEKNKTRIIIMRKNNPKQLLRLFPQVVDEWGKLWAVWRSSTLLFLLLLPQHLLQPSQVNSHSTPHQLLFPFSSLIICTNSEKSDTMHCMRKRLGWLFS